MQLESLLKEMVAKRASDVFILPGLPLSYKLGGQLIRTNSVPLSPTDTEEFARTLYHAANRDAGLFLESKNHDDDFSFALPGVGRFRANFFHQRGSVGAVIRVIPFGLPNPQELSIPETVLDMSELKKGLVIVSGAAGSGKSTTLACIIDRLNKTRSGHIITMEDPIEYVHRHNNCIVTQREIPTDVATYCEALSSAMRESPDVILLGEMNTPDTTSMALTAAEMSPLLFTTLHTTGAVNTINRIIDIYPAKQQNQIRTQLAMSLQAVISQQLVPSVEGGVIPVFEIMVVNDAIRSLIRKDKTHQIKDIMETNNSEYMMTMDQSLYNLYKQGKITKETVLQYGFHQESLGKRLSVEGKHVSK